MNHHCGHTPDSHPDKTVFRGFVEQAFQAVVGKLFHALAQQLYADEESSQTAEKGRDGIYVLHKEILLYDFATREL